MDNQFISAIDNHNIANGDESWADRKLRKTGELLTNVYEGSIYGIPSALVAGVNSILNTGIAVTNFVSGGDTDPINTHKVLQDFDDNLGKYYEENKTGVEVGGFILGALVPGTLGIKALQAAKAGFLGTNMARSSGLMKSLTYDYANAAKIEFASGNSPFTILNANVVKGLAQGFGNQALEAAAFETAVMATMYKSPTLDGQSAGDLAHHLLVGTLIGGGIGGVLHGVGLVHGIKREGSAIDKELFPYKHILGLDNTASPELRIINYYQQKFNMPDAELGAGIRTTLSEADRLTLIKDASQQTRERLDVLIQTEFQRFSGGDEQVANQLFDSFQASAKTVDDVIKSLLHAKSAKRITEGESLEFGEVLFPIHNLKVDAVYGIMNNKNFNDMFLPRASSDAQGYKVIGNIDDLRVAGAHMGGEGLTKDTAFAQGYDIFRNANGILSINPGSKILIASQLRRLENNLIVDFQQGGAIVDKATPGLADLASKEFPIKVYGNTVTAGENRAIQVVEGNKFNPTQDGHLEAQARYIWAQEQKVANWKGKVIDENDLPMLEKAYYDQAEGWILKRTTDEPTGMALVAGPEKEVLRVWLENKKISLAEQMDGKPLDEIALRLNVSENFLQGGKDEVAVIRPGYDFQKPRYARVDFRDDLNALETYNANGIDGAIEYARQVENIKQRHLQTFSNFAKDIAEQFPDAPNWSDPTRTPTRYGAGASLFGFSNSNYGTAGGWAQFVGTFTNKLKVFRKTDTAEVMNPVAAEVAAVGPIALAELSMVTNKLRSMADSFVFHPNNPLILIPRSSLNGVLANKIKGDIENAITIQNPAVAAFLRTHGERVNERQIHIKNLKASAGVGDDADGAVVYPPPIDTVKYKHFVFVEPRELSLGDKKRIIAAKDEATLGKLIDQVDKNEFRVITKQEAEDYHKAVGDYEFQLGINESKVNSELKRKGILTDFFPTTADQRILDDYMGWHMKQEEILATTMVEHRYSQSFEELRQLGRQYTNVATSQFRGLTDRLEQSVKDPYTDIVKTALDISRAKEYQWWKSFNETVRDAIEIPVNKLRNAFQSTKVIDDAFVNKVNKFSEELGLGTPYKTTAQAILADSNVAPKPWLARGIAKSQSILSTTLLQLDFFNAINNSVATPIILSAEVNTLRKAILAANPEVAGKLANLMKVRVPESGSLEIPTTARLIKEAVEDYRADHIGDGKLLLKYRNLNAITDVLQQERQMVDQLTIDFSKLTEREMQTRLDKAVEFGKKFTGNKLAEEMTRFVSARVMDKITSFGIEAGVITAKEADEYIQLFVNRTQGNYLHSQRPIVFQGVVGQAVSLFQTYQFNLMQQLFRYVGEGDKKSIAILLGLQGSIYGMQGLPAFNFINTHIVGNASGNTNHRDLHYAANTVFGKELGDWMLYGLGSNALGVIDPSMKVNLYSRGDINPRQLTVLPTSIEDVPIVSASVRFVQNIFQAGSRLAGGAAFWPTISQAVEHNAISRPLAGLAQVTQGYSTTNQASLLSGGQDFWNVATLARVGGGKPFDEAVALDALYRINAYRAKDIAKIQDLGSAVKTTLVGNAMPSQDQITDFAQKYAKSGGRIENFNRFFANAMTTANRSQVNAVAQKLNSPFAQQLQVIMGGQPLPDFLNQPKETP